MLPRKNRTIQAHPLDKIAENATPQQLAKWEALETISSKYSILVGDFQIVRDGDLIAAIAVEVSE